LLLPLPDLLDWDRHCTFFLDGAERAQISKLVHRRFLRSGGAVHLLAIADNYDYCGPG
jgi:hypothetical protein